MEQDISHFLSLIIAVSEFCTHTHKHTLQIYDGDGGSTANRQLCSTMYHVCIMGLNDLYLLAFIIYFVLGASRSSFQSGIGKGGFSLLASG